MTFGRYEPFYDSLRPEISLHRVLLGRHHSETGGHAAVVSLNVIINQVG